MLPELADLGQLFKITHWHRKSGGTRENEVFPCGARGTVPNFCKCFALTLSLQPKPLFQREPFAAAPCQGLAAGNWSPELPR